MHTRWNLLWGVVLGLGLGLGLGAGLSVGLARSTSSPCAKLLSGDPPVHVPRHGYGHTEAATEAGRLVMAYLDTRERSHLEEALASYEAIIGQENIGGEYRTLAWFCRYELASGPERRQMLQDPEGRRFVEKFAPDRFRLLRGYLDNHYFRQTRSLKHHMFLDELIRFNSPGREAWERSDRVLELLDLQPGEVVGDIGSGPGFYSFRFADRVGPEGRVYAVETNELHLEYLDEVVEREGIANIEPVSTTGATVPVPDGSLDLAFLCGTWQALYARFDGEVRDAFAADLKRALKPGGRVVVIENDPYTGDAPPYRGVRLAESLVRVNLESYGLELVDRHRFVPQRYVLVMRWDRKS